MLPPFIRMDRETTQKIPTHQLNLSGDKVLESIIADRIVDHLAMTNLLGNCQHGFRCNRECLTKHIEFLNDMI